MIHKSMNKIKQISLKNIDYSMSTTWTKLYTVS